jgi:hypothetical protein
LTDRLPPEAHQPVENPGWTPPVVAI